MDTLLEKINRLTNWQVALIIGAIGISIAWTGLANPFMYDDIGQIVNNVPVHSAGNIPSFFGESTFYNGNAKLSGTYYRPLMTTTFSLLYGLFGLHTIAFHLLQLILYAASAFLLYLVFRYSFNAILSLFLSLIFLVHPLNSQVLFAIPTMQDALFFFFGILAIWLLLRFRSFKSLVAVAACIFLSLLSKESGALFAVIASVYLLWFDRKRLLPFIGIVALPMTLYLILKVHAVGFLEHSNIAPIDHLNLWERLMTAPSILLFYVSKFIFPMHLATGYYWTYKNFSVTHVLVPLAIDSVIAGLAIYLTIAIRKRLPKAMYYTYLFFGSWAILGLVIYLQVVPLDFTACESWFYFTMAGLLGMVGVVLTAYGKHIRPLWFLIIAVVLVSLLGIRTAARGSDWSNPVKLASIDISVSKENYNALNTLSSDLAGQGKYEEAKEYATRSINIYPTYNNYSSLGVALEGLNDVPGAVQAFNRGLQYGGSSILYEKLGEVALVYGDLSAKQFLVSALNALPQDGTLWMDLAIFEDKFNNNLAARAAITKAASYGQVPPALYGHIMNNQPFMYAIPDLKQSVAIQ